MPGVEGTLQDHQWQGEAAYIVGGGPSLENLDWSLLRDRKRIIAINMAFLNVPHADVWFSEDLRVIEELILPDPSLRAAWESFKGVKVLHALAPSHAERARELDPSLVIIERKREDKYWSRSLADGLSISSNSAVGSINLACILGANPIYLLGIDCRVKDGKSNFHSHYPKDWGLAKGQDASFKSDFENWVELHTRDRSIINLIDPEFPSAIECWPKRDRTVALKLKGVDHGRDVDRAGGVFGLRDELLR